MQYFFFHLMPWRYLPDGFDRQYDRAISESRHPRAFEDNARGLFRIR